MLMGRSSVLLPGNLYIRKREGFTVIISFKSIVTNKDGQYLIRYVIEEEKGDSSIKSTVSIILDDVEILDSQPLAEIIEKGMAIAKRTYLYKN
jgi:hypothetical protein